MRQIINLNHDWYYVPTYYDRFITNNYSGCIWHEVTLPHTNKQLPYNYFDEREYQFISTYRRSFSICPDNKDSRVFIDFDGVMTYAEVYVNGNFVGSHEGGYTPFSCEITDVVCLDDQNQVVIKVDSTERADIPPFGNVIDYLSYGGIYRDVNLRIVDPVYIENVFAKQQNVLNTSRELVLEVYLHNTLAHDLEIELEARLQKGNIIAENYQIVQLRGLSSTCHYLHINNIKDINLWHIDDPNLYEIEVLVKNGGKAIDKFITKIGFREAIVKADGFYLNGKKLKIRGLNRHQSWPYVGYAMPKRVQRRDADILKHELHLNTVRTSHYPQSKHFLDRCDEIGLLVIEEMPGWQHIGDLQWQNIACKNLRAMIRRDWNHPSIFLWGVRINESPDDHNFYTKTNRIAHELDPTRQTCGVRAYRRGEFLEDVYTINDFSHDGGKLVLADQKAMTGFSHYVPYILTESNGHMYPTKRFDHEERIVEHSLRHIRVMSSAGADPHIAGSIGWCAFDYNTHYQFGSGDRICYHGVMDMFRIPKFAANAYRSQVNPEIDPVLQPITLWARGERSIGGVFPLTIFTNCDAVEMKVDGKSLGHYYPDSTNYPGVEYPPIVITHAPKIFGQWGCHWYSGEFIGYYQGKPLINRQFAKNPVLKDMEIKADDLQLQADGMDMTRVVFKLVDQFGNLLPYINEWIRIEIEGPGELIGPQQTAVIGGCIACWVRTKPVPGVIRLSGRSSRLQSKQIEITTI